MSRNGFLHHRRILDCSVLIFVLDGELHITQREQRFTVSAGEYILLNSGEEHFGHMPSDGTLSYLWVHFTTEEPFETITNDGDLTPPDGVAFMLAEKQAASAQRTGMFFRLLMDLSMHESPYADKMPLYALQLLLTELSRELADTDLGIRGKISPLVYEVREWLKSNCRCHGISVGAVAAEFHYSPAYLSALFKRETGMTIIGYLNKSRIEVSKILLASNNISVKEAAYSGGFNDEKYFMRIFKRSEGMTPLQYRGSLGTV